MHMRTDRIPAFHATAVRVRGTHFYAGRGHGGPNVAKALDWISAG